MTQRDAAFLGCRLMAVWFGIVGAIQLPFVVSSRLAMEETLGHERRTGTILQKIFETYTLVMPALQLVAAAILFYGAGWLSRLLSANPEADGSAPKGKGLLGVGALLIGLHFAVENLPGLVGNTYDRMTSDSANRVPAETVVPNLVGVLLAGGIIVWAALQSRRSGLTGGEDPD